MEIFNARMIFYLAGVVQTFPDNAVHNDPGEDEEAEEVSLNLPHLWDVLAHVEHLVTAKLIDHYCFEKVIKESFDTQTSFFRSAH